MVAPSSTKFNKTKRKLDIELKHEARVLKRETEIMKKFERCEKSQTRKEHKGRFCKLDSGENSKHSKYTKKYKTPMKILKIRGNIMNSDKSGTKDTYVPTIEFDMLADKNVTTFDRQMVSIKHTDLQSNETLSFSKINSLQSSQKFTGKNKIQTSLEIYSNTFKASKRSRFLMK